MAVVAELIANKTTYTFITLIHVIQVCNGMCFYFLKSKYIRLLLLDELIKYERIASL
jgi:hypothetical protein